MPAATFVGRYWHGDGPLWRVYWLWGVLGSLLLAALFGWAAERYGVTGALYAVSALTMSAYTVWILVSVWRCAANARSRHWGQVARFLTAAWALNIVLVGGFLGLDLLFA